MKPSKDDVKKWFGTLSPQDRKTVDDAQVQSSKAARPLLKKAGFIDDSTTDAEVMDILRMRF